jgi:hypothetical protein
MKMNRQAPLRLVDTTHELRTKEGRTAGIKARGKGVAYLHRKRWRNALLSAGCVLGFAAGLSLVFFSPFLWEYIK